MTSRQPSPFSLARAFYEDLDAAGVMLDDDQYRIFKGAFRRKIKEAREKHDDTQGTPGTTAQGSTYAPYW